MKKGRHRRFEEARALKRITFEPNAEPCDECGAGADEPCASWCLARVPDDDDDDSDDFGADEHNPSTMASAPTTDAAGH